MKKRDLILILLAVLLAAALFAASRLYGSGEAAAVVVRLNGEEILRKPLAVDAEYPVEQDDGSHNLIAVEGGCVYMKEANCRDGLCMHQGKLRSQAGTIVCLPHNLVVSLDGELPATEEDDLDVIVY